MTEPIAPRLWLFDVLWASYLLIGVVYSTRVAWRVLCARGGFARIRANHPEVPLIVQVAIPALLWIECIVTWPAHVVGRR